MPKSQPARCRTCGVRPRPWVRVRLPEGGHGYYCETCGEPAKAAAQERQRERWARLKKTTKPPAVCTKSPVGAHYFPDLRQTYDERHRCGDAGTCAFCGLERFWPRPSEADGKWRHSILPKKSAA